MVLLVGYILMAFAPNIWLLAPAIAVRSMGSSCIWVYSTLLLQLAVPNRLQGRIFALEMAFFTVYEVITFL